MTEPDAAGARRGDTPLALSRGPVRRCPGIDPHPWDARSDVVRQRTKTQERSLRSLWGNFSRITATGEASCVGITKLILLVTDGRIGPAFDSTVRTSLRLEPPHYSTDWIGTLDRIADDLAAFESLHGPLANAVPKRFGHLAVGRLYDMVFGPGAPSRSGSSRSGARQVRR